MQDSILISIIIPVYNASSFIARAIESCLLQSCNNFELILVNDGSKDDSLEIIKKYAERINAQDSTPIIRVISIPNSGVVKAREIGVKESKGAYLLFLDADDTLVEGSLQDLTNALAPEIDMVVGDINQIEVNGTSSIIKYGLNGCYSGIDHFDWILKEHTGFLWGKLIKRSLFDGIAVVPYSVKFCEDYLQMIQISYNASKIVHIGKVSYNYIQQEESACNKAIPVKDYAQRFADLCYYIKKIICTCGFDEKSLIKLKVLFLYYCRLYLCSYGKWDSNIALRASFEAFLNDVNVIQYYKSIDFRRYIMTRIVSWFYPLISIVYCWQLRKFGRIV